MKISIILPTRNEEKILKYNIENIDLYIRKFFDEYEIILAEDGSKDKTSKIASELAIKNERIIHIHSEKRLGKGQALKRAIKVSKGDIVVFMDVDLSTSLNNLPKLINSIHRGYDIAIGSRYKEGSRVKRPITRTIASRTYNLLVNLLFKDGILDHQCGFKAFKRQSIEPLIEAVKSKGFFFDTELILKAMRRGLSIVEIPVEWKETRKEPALRKIIAMAPEMLWELLALKLSGEVEGRFEG